MSILIKMEMPTRCAECRMADGDTYDGFCHAAEMWFDDDRWRWFVYEEDDIDTDKPLNCPLIEIPPHGKLIDADAKVQTQLYDDEHEEWTDVEMTVEEYLGYCNNEVPTIIEAEEGET